MKKIYLSLLCLLILGKTSAQEILNTRWIYQDTLSSRLIFESKFKIGEFKEYRTTYKKNKFKGDSLVKEEIIADNVARIYVIDSTDDSYSLKFQIIKNLKEYSHEQNELINEIKGSLNDRFTDNDLIINYTTNNAGAFEQYTHEKDVVRVLDVFMDEIRKNKLSELNKLSKKEKAKIEELLEIIATGSVLFKNLYGIPISNLHGINGLVMAIDDTLAFSERSPLVNMKKPLDSDCLLYINSVDTTTNEVEYVIEKWMDSEVLTEFMKQLLKNQFSKSELDKLNIEGYVKSVLFVDPRQNWPSLVKVIKEIYSTDSASGNVETSQEIWYLDEVIPENP